MLTSVTLRALLRLPETADTSKTFDDLGVDSWDFIELRTTLENRFDLHFSDDEWMSLNCPNDILSKRAA